MPDSTKIYSEGLEYVLNRSKDGYIVKGIGDCSDTDIKIPNSYQELPVVENRCPVDKTTKRTEVKELIFNLSKTYPDLKERVFGAMQRYPLPEWEPKGRYKRPKEQE